ncbi:MAG: hypothetical protein HRF50_06770 [Phycisphaerae bacterium]|jgi:hypothetical protein
MIRRSSIAAFSCMVAICAAAQTAARAEEPPREPREPGAGYSAIIDNIDLLIDNYSRFLARQYNLSDEQNGITRELLRDRAYKFLNKHEEELRGLVDRMFEVRTGGAMTPEELVEWGRRAAPLYEEAKQAIVEGNNDWRQILNDEQKKTHDQVLQQMQESFVTTEEQLERIVSGQMTVDEFRNPRSFGRSARRNAARNRAAAPSPDAGPEDVPPPETGAGPIPPGSEPPPSPGGPGGEAGAAAGDAGTVHTPPGERPRRINRPTREGEPLHPNAGRGGAAAGRDARPHRDAGDASPEGRSGRPRARRGTEKVAGGPEFASQWEQYVREFIQRYGLNEEQQQQAQAILKDCQAQGERHIRGKKSEMDRIDARVAELRNTRDAAATKEIAELNEQRQKLIEPIEQIFEKSLKPRLEKLPTRAQRKAAEAAANKPKSDGKPASKPAKDRSQDEAP